MCAFEASGDELVTHGDEHVNGARGWRAERCPVCAVARTPQHTRGWSLVRGRVGAAAPACEGRNSRINARSESRHFSPGATAVVGTKDDRGSLAETHRRRAHGPLHEP